MRAILLLAFVLAACTKTGTLYPIDITGNSAGPISVEYEDSPFALGGTVRIYMQGEILTGEYRTVDTTTQTFGSIFSSIRNSETGLTSESAAQSSMTIQGGSPGFLAAYGSQGTTIECEYIANRSGGGTGTCRTGDGRYYRLIF